MEIVFAELRNSPSIFLPNIFLIDNSCLWLSDHLCTPDLNRINGFNTSKASS